MRNGVAVAPGPGSAPAGRRPVICGLGMTDLGKVYGPTAAQFAADAVRLAATSSWTWGCFQRHDPQPEAVPVFTPATAW